MNTFPVGFLFGLLCGVLALSYGYQLNPFTGERPPDAKWNITINGVTHKFDKDQNYIGTEKE